MMVLKFDVFGEQRWPIIITIVNKHMFVKMILSPNKDPSRNREGLSNLPSTSSDGRHRDNLNPYDPLLRGRDLASGRYKQDADNRLPN